MSRDHSGESLQELRRRMDILQGRSALYRAMLQVESAEASRIASGIARGLSTGLTAGRFLSSLFCRRR